jgi:hypothetical protein
LQSSSSRTARAWSCLRGGRIAKAVVNAPAAHALWEIRENSKKARRIRSGGLFF